jgi:tetratricopeptide (TPR) repeat protein
MILVLNRNLFASSYPAYKVFLKGIFDLKAGNVKNAIKDYEKVIALDKDALLAYKNLAYLYYKSGKSDKAFQMADKINDFDGNNPQTTIFLAEFYFGANKLDIAKQFCEKTIKIDPDNEMALAYLAIYYYLDSKFEESVKYWNMFLQQQTDNAMGHFQLGVALEKLAMYEAALKSYDHVIRICPQDKDAYIAKARIYETTGKLDLALKERKKYVSVSNDNVFELMYLGRRYYETKDYTKAKDCFLRAKEYDRNNILPSFWLGITYEQMGRLGKAVEEFEAIAQTKDKNISVLTRLGYCYSVLQKYSKAEETFLKASNIAPLNSEILYLTALNYMDWGKYNKAIKYLNKAIENKTIEPIPDFANMYFYLGLAYDKNKDFENAQKAFLKAIEINPNHSRAMNYLGYAYADRGIKLKESEEFLIRSTALEPENSDYLGSLGWLYYRQGKFDLAEKLLLTAANGIKDYLIYAHLGDADVALNKFGQAWIAYSLSYDFKQDENIKRKLNIAQEKMSQEELYKQMLLRSTDNYLRLSSFRAGFKVKFGPSFFSKKLYMPFSYTQFDNNIKMELPANVVMGGISISIKNQKAEITPKAFEKEVSPVMSNFILQACNIFSGNFYKQFSDAKITRKGDSLIYSKENANLTLNINTALIENLSQGDMIVKILKYESFRVSKIPTKIKITSKSANIECLLEATKISPVANNVKNENKSLGSGKN